MITSLAFRVAFQKSLTPTAIVGGDGKFMLANEAFCHLVEYSEFELMGMKFSEITDPADLFNDEHEAVRVRDGAIESYEMIKSYITKTKKLVRVRLRVDAVRNDKSEFVCFVAQAPEYLSSNALIRDVKPRNLALIRLVAWVQRNDKLVFFILIGLLSLAGYFFKIISEK